ncbi:hypothetical protein SO802_030893 [Lithocarpus litseifolius]|uniref:RNase H type-1 domain-containing protein n=1 Tax=Lithocarpus litseifolius TaxID=425828 RepID=A0AAW2BL88_9ROSI
MTSIKRKLERQQGLVVPSVRRGGGLALLWKNSTRVDVQTYSPRHIDAIVTEEQGNKKWRFTGFYGNPETSKREESWKLLEQLSKSCDLPWVCMGDFNEIMHAGEKVGGNVRPDGQMRNFCEAVNRCKLRDIGYIGPDFTWSRRLGSRGWVRERLDRALVSTNWALCFPHVRLLHVATSVSDHSMLVLKTDSNSRRSPRRPKLFRFESMWLRDDRCNEIVSMAWEKGVHGGTEWPFSKCLEECRTALVSWNKSTFGNVGWKISSLQRKLQILEERQGNCIDMEEIYETKMELNKMLKAEEDMWHQRSRNSWLKSGDRNTSYFHTKASNRNQRNLITKIMDSNGAWQDENEKIGNMFVEYFEKLFTSSQPVVIRPHESYLGLPSLVGKSKRNTFAQLKQRIANKPSYAWRSIHAAQALVRRGLRWQVGNGEHIRIWKDKWLPTPKTYKVVTPERGNTQVTMVCDLIDNESKEWKVDVVRQNFLAQDVEAILSIPLSVNGARDKIVWAENKNGRFSVRSAYKVAQAEGLDGEGAGCSSSSEIRKVWRFLWGMNLPNKIKHFAWKACRNILATKENLRRRNIVDNGLCVCCGSHTETVGHLFWFCDHAKEIWTSSKLSTPFEVMPSWDFMEVMCQVQRWNDSFPGLVERTVMICWGIWKNRNEIIHGGTGRPGRVVVRSALMLLDEYQTANESPKVGQKSTHATVRWSPPQQECYKVNVDGAVFTRRRQTGIGVVIRDSAGEVVAALCKRLAVPLGALETEAKAMESGVRFAAEVGIRDVIFEGDSLTVYNAVHGGTTSSAVQNIITGILQQVQGFRTFAFSHVKRQGNVPAHVLAQHACNIDEDVIWLEECPSQIETACAQDAIRTLISKGTGSGSYPGGIYAYLLPKGYYFPKALYTFDIGQNDLAEGFLGNMTMEEVSASIPDIVNKFSINVKNIYNLGARSFWIHNTGPIGCLPLILATFLSAQRDSYGCAKPYNDSYGCAKPYNDVAQYFNHKLKEAIVQLTKDLPLAAITYVDIINFLINF